MPLSIVPPSDVAGLTRDLAAASRKLSGIDVDRDLVRTEALGTAFAFADCRIALEELVRLGSGFQDDLEDMPIVLRTRALSGVQEVARLTDRLGAFDASGSEDPTRQREELLTDVERVYTTVALDLAYAHSWVDQRRIAREVHSSDRATQLVTEIEQLRDEASLAVEAAQQSAGLSSVAKHGEIFQREASNHEGAATRWLYCAGLLAVAALAWAVAGVSAAHLPKNATTAEIVTATTSRVGVLTLLIAALVFASRNYSINRHVALMFRQKRVAIETLQGFTAWLDDDSLRQTVVLEVTKVIFAPGATGYLQASSEGADTTLLGLAAAAAKR